MAATLPCLEQRKLSETNVSSVACIFPTSGAKKRTSEEIRDKLAVELRKKMHVEEPKKSGYGIELSIKQDLIFLNVSSIEKPISSEAWTFVNNFKFSLRPLLKTLDYVSDDDMQVWKRFCIDEHAMCGSYEKTLEHKLLSDREFDIINTPMRKFNADGTIYYEGVKEWDEYVMQEVFGQIYTFDCGIVGKFKYRSLISFDLDRLRVFVERVKQNYNNVASSSALRVFLYLREAPFQGKTSIGLPEHFTLSMNNQNMELGSVVKDFYLPVIVKYMTPLFNNVDDLEYPTGTLQYYIYSKRDDTLIQDSSKRVCVYFCMKCFKTGCFQAFVDVTRYKFHLFYCKNRL